MAARCLQAARAGLETGKLQGMILYFPKPSSWGIMPTDRPRAAKHVREAFADLRAMCTRGTTGIKLCLALGRSVLRQG